MTQNLMTILYLAQVQKNSVSEEIELQLLAQQKSDYNWNYWVMEPPRLIPIGGQESFGEDILVLVELDENQKIVQLQEAKDWVLDLIQQYLKGDENLTEELIEKEKAEIENLRQDLTLKSQEIQQKELEIETRIEQLKALEQDISTE